MSNTSKHYNSLSYRLQRLPISQLLKVWISACAYAYNCEFGQYYDEDDQNHTRDTIDACEHIARERGFRFVYTNSQWDWELIPNDDMPKTTEIPF